MGFQCCLCDSKHLYSFPCSLMSLWSPLTLPHAWIPSKNAHPVFHVHTPMSGMAFLIEKFSLHQKSVPIWTPLSGPGSTLGTPKVRLLPPLLESLWLSLWFWLFMMTLAMAGSTQAWLWREGGIYRGWLKGENFDFGFGKAPPKDQSVYWQWFMGFVFVLPNPKS